MPPTYIDLVVKSHQNILNIEKRIDKQEKLSNLTRLSKETVIKDKTQVKMGIWFTNSRPQKPRKRKGILDPPYSTVLPRILRRIGIKR